MKANFTVIGLTGPVIKPESTAPEADDLITWPSVWGAVFKATQYKILHHFFG